MTATLNDNAEAGRFEMSEGGQVVFADYRRGPGRLFIDHVEAPLALRGSGAAGRLMAAIVQRAENDGEQIVPVCGYAAAWLRRHRRD
jgi:uncharacterized protein